MRLFGPLLFTSRQIVMRTLLTLLILVVDLSSVGLVPTMTKTIITALNDSSSSLSAIGLLLGGFTLFWILSHITSYLMEMAFFPVLNDAIKRLTARSVERMHSVSLLHSQRLDSAEVLSATSRISLGARLFFKAVCLSILPTIGKLFLAMALVWHLPGINLCLAISIILSAAAAYLLIPRYVQARKQAWAFTDARAVKMIDSLLNTKVVRFSFEPEMEKLNDYLEREALGWQRAINQSNLVGVCMVTLFGVSLGCILYLVVSAELYPLTEFVYLQTLLVGVFMQVRHTLLDMKHLAECYADVERVLKLLELSNETEETGVQPLFCSASEAILCQNLCFTYPTGQTVLRDVSLRVEHGRKIAIVGANGSGKSTLLHLLSGLYAPQKGEVSVAGLPAHQMPQKGASVGFCFLPQDVFLFNGTFYENLVYGVDSPSTKRVSDAINAAGLDAVVERLPHGLHTCLGEFGKLLSGGEKQRLALARAMILKPRVLILDESLNSVDVETEKKILKTLCELVPTIVMVSHRESVLAYCDEVFQVEDGKVSPKVGQGQRQGHGQGHVQGQGQEHGQGQGHGQEHGQGQKVV